MAGKKGRSGRPANETKLFSDEIINNVKTAAKKLEQEHNIPIEEAALSLIYDDKVQASVKSAVFKAYCDCFVEKSSKQKDYPNVDVDTAEVEVHFLTRVVKRWSTVIAKLGTGHRSVQASEIPISVSGLSGQHGF